MMRMVVGASVIELALALAAVGCAAPVEGGTGPEVDTRDVEAKALVTGGTTTTTTTTDSGGIATVYNPPSTTIYVGPPPAPVCSRQAPNYVVRLPDSDSHYYYFNNGYTIPFTTPWITGDKLLATDYPHLYVYEPVVASYEHAVYAIPSSVTHEHLVRLVLVSGGFIKSYDTQDEKEYFLVGYTSLTDWNTAWNTAQQYAGYANVQSKILSCVHVIQDNGDGQPYSEIETFPFADEHDPSSHPW